ncbi:hypothetical protein PoB_005813400 [Plakobranchus ocellatus]|uniref:Uncharacterized protein n=1 Tax=Plakobranchus ocellatus TaxID=259542 RepID=A0AAV4CKD8_9GAST|nr:hypothetical protein PoB_005813400 [Plakobranchus ocellatus]
MFCPRASPPLLPTFVSPASVHQVLLSTQAKQILLLCPARLDGQQTRVTWKVEIKMLTGGPDQWSLQCPSSAHRTVSASIIYLLASSR